MLCLICPKRGDVATRLSVRYNCFFVRGDGFVYCVVVSCVGARAGWRSRCGGRRCLFVGRPVFVLREGGCEKGELEVHKLACWRECIKLTDRFLRLIIYFLVPQIT